MSLDGLRAWIGEVERKLGMRTRVFLALAVIAIGIGGAAIYLAIDARESAVSESDVQALQEELEARIGAGGVSTGGAEARRLEAELKALREEVAALEGKGGGASKGGGAGAGESAGDDGSTQGSSGSTGAPGAGSAAIPPDGIGTIPDGVQGSAKIQEMVEETRKKLEEAE
jgi:hypothetical protein